MKVHFSAEPPNALWARVVCNRRAPVERHTRDADEVTCKRCLTWMAQKVVGTLGPQRCSHCSGQGVVEVHGGGSGYPKGGGTRVVKACPVCGGSGWVR